jgi:hypothetical protein
VPPAFDGKRFEGLPGESRRTISLQLAGGPQKRRVAGAGRAREALPATERCSRYAEPPTTPLPAPCGCRRELLAHMIEQAGGSVSKSPRTPRRRSTCDQVRLWRSRDYQGRRHRRRYGLSLAHFTPSAFQPQRTPSSTGHQHRVVRRSKNAHRRAGSQRVYSSSISQEYRRRNSCRRSLRVWESSRPMRNSPSHRRTRCTRS